jgi:hypothetical protein
MIDPWVELGGWMIAQAIDDICHPKTVEPEDLESAWKFLREDPAVDQILEYIDYGTRIEDKRTYILTVVIPQKMKNNLVKPISSN